MTEKEAVTEIMMPLPHQFLELVGVFIKERKILSSITGLLKIKNHAVAHGHKEILLLCPSPFPPCSSCTPSQGLISALLRVFSELIFLVSACQRCPEEAC
jgi:hypothetical protein